MTAATPLLVEIKLNCMQPPSKTGAYFRLVSHTLHDVLPIASYGVTVHCAWKSVANEFVWMRSYDESATLEKYENSPERAVYSPKLRPCIEKTEIRVGLEELVGTKETRVPAHSRCGRLIVHYCLASANVSPLAKL